MLSWWPKSSSRLLPCLLPNAVEMKESKPPGSLANRRDPTPLCPWGCTSPYQCYAASPFLFFLINILKNPIIFYVFLHPFLYREVSYTWADVLRYKESCRKRRLFQGEPRLLCRKRSILFRGKQNLQPKETDVYIITKTFAERGRNSDCRQRFKRKFCYSPDQKN